MMTRKRRRLIVLLLCGLGLGSATGLSLWALSGDVAFFTSPTELVRHPPGPDRVFRLGGLVEAGSVTRGALDGKPSASFRVTDGAATVTVNYVGILPDLFREGQGVVAEGTLDGSGTFDADTILAKHDATYMPKEVVDALKRSGHWKDEYEQRASLPNPGASK